jgi:diadenosine tetraphosphate (Ap4A) HIT family hydrolase
MVVWRGRHVADPAEMSDDEARNYFSEVVEVGRLLNAVFQPAQLNYLTFGNSVPHVHTYLLPRYLDDPSPGLPLDPFTEVPVSPEIFAEQLALLQSQQEKRSG